MPLTSRESPRLSYRGFSCLTREQDPLIEVKNIWRHRNEGDDVLHFTIQGRYGPPGTRRWRRHIRLTREANAALFDFLQEQASIGEGRTRRQAPFEVVR